MILLYYYWYKVLEFQFFNIGNIIFIYKYILYGFNNNNYDNSNSINILICV